MKNYITLLRPQQWIKNFFIFIPAFFAAKIGLLLTDGRLFSTFAAYCAAASAIYIFNDLFDVEKDKLHERKRLRPLAAGTISKNSARLLCVALTAIALLLASTVNYTVAAIIGGYLSLNALYSIWLKHQSLIDVTCIALGFILRILAGGAAVRVPISKWLVLMTFLLASCLALGKRRDDLLLTQHNADNQPKEKLRPALRGYTLEFVDASLLILAATTIVCYIMYTVSDEVVHRLKSDLVYLTAIPVIIGVLRYLQIAIVEQKSGSPTKILWTDPLIQITIAIWTAAFLLLLYAV